MIIQQKTMDHHGVFSIKYALPSRRVGHDRLGEKFHSHTRSFSYMESFILFLAPYPHIWGHRVVCIKCGSMWVDTYTRADL